MVPGRTAARRGRGGQPCGRLGAAWGREAALCACTRCRRACRFVLLILVCRYASPAITEEVSISYLAHIRGPHRGEELLELVLLPLLRGQDHHREVLV